MLMKYKKREINKINEMKMRDNHAHEMKMR